MASSAAEDRAAPARDASSAGRDDSSAGRRRRRRIAPAAARPAAAVRRGVDRGVQNASSSSSSQNRVSEVPAMSKLVQYSPTCGSTGSRPALAQQLGDAAVDDEQLLVLDEPRPLRIGTTRAPARSRRPRAARRAGATRAVRPVRGGDVISSMPGSPWMPSPMAMRPSGTENSGCSAPGRVQPVNATPNGARAASPTAGSAEVVEHLVAGVIARGEGDAGAAMASGAAEVEAVDPIGMSRKPLGPGRLGPIRSGCSKPWQKSPAGAPNMVFMWYGANVMCRITMSLKLGACRLILSITRCVLAGRRHARVMDRRDLHAQRRGR